MDKLYPNTDAAIEDVFDGGTSRDLHQRLPGEAPTIGPRADDHHRALHRYRSTTVATTSRTASQIMTSRSLIA